MKSTNGLRLGSLVLALQLGHASMAAPQAPTYGIGVAFARVNAELWVDSVVAGSPADAAGLRVGDNITMINDTATPHVTDAAVVALVQGAQGTAVRLIVAAPGKPVRTVTVPRSIPTVTAAASSASRPSSGIATTAGTTPTAPPRNGPAPPVAPAPARAAGATSPSPSITFVTWVDPKEHSFSLEVPQGWNVTGGLNWVGPQEPATFVRAESPDGKLQIFIGDADLMPRQVPTPIAVAANRTAEGGVFRTPIGDPVLMQRYMPGSQFAKYEVTTRHCPNPRWLSEGDHPDTARAVADVMQPQAAQLNMTATASAGDAGFVCEAREGYAEAVTLLVTGNGGAQQAWMVQGLGVFLSADPMQSMLARYILEHMMGTQKSDPQWEAAYNKRVAQSTGAAISMQNAQFQVQQGAARSSSNTLSMMNHPNQGVSARPGQGSSSSVNTTLGTRDMCDAIGRCKTVSLAAGDVFMDHSGNVVPGPASGGPPDNTGVWSPMYQR